METCTEQELIETETLQRVIGNPEYMVTFITTAAESGMRLSGKQALVNPFLPMLYRLAYKKGYERGMIKKYCI